MVVSPGVRHLPELLSVTLRTRVHGNMGTTMAGVREIFGLPVILTNTIKGIGNYWVSNLRVRLRWRESLMIHIINVVFLKRFFVLSNKYIKKHTS